MPVDVISHVAQLVKDMPTGLHFTDRLGNPHADDPENNTGPMTIRFVDAPSDTQNIGVENTEIDNLTNNANVDPDNITIRITGVTDEEKNENEIKNTIDNSIRDDDNPIEGHDYGYAGTEEGIEQTGVDPKDDTIRPTGVSITYHDIGTT